MIKIHTHKFENDLYARLDSDLVQTYGCCESESGEEAREVVTPWVSTVDTSLYRCTCGKKIESDGHTATAICYDCMIFWELDSLWMSHLFDKGNWDSSTVEVDLMRVLNEDDWGELSSK